jgi:hypothetical protein
MLAILFYYLALPFLAASLVLRFIRRYGKDPVPEPVRKNCVDDPVEPKWFRVLEAEAAVGGTPARFNKVGDFDAHDKAVDAAYQSRGSRPESGRSWLVLNQKGDVLQEIS